MKKMKQRKVPVRHMISACMAAITIFAAVPTAMAASYSPATPMSVVSMAADPGVAPTANDTVWYYRFHEGKWQKRQWSKTQAKWLTDWIDCE